MFKKAAEYIKLIPRAIQNADKIVEGYINHIKLQHGSLPEDEQEEILKRRLICSSCPYNSVQAKTSIEYKELYGKNYETARTDFHCSHCGCPEETLTASLSKDCGLEFYNQNHANKIPLRWTAFKPKEND